MAAGKMRLISLLLTIKRQDVLREDGSVLNKDRPTDVTCFLFPYLMLNMFRMLIHPFSGACDLLWIYFMGCIALVRCVLVLRCGLAGVVWYPYVG